MPVGLGRVQEVVKTATRTPPSAYVAGQGVQQSFEGVGCGMGFHSFASSPNGHLPATRQGLSVGLPAGFSHGRRGSTPLSPPAARACTDQVELDPVS